MRTFLTRSLLASTMMATAADSVTGGTAAPAAPKPKTVIEDMDSRRMFANTEEAANYLNKMSEELADFGNHPQVINGVDSEGNFDPAVYTDSTRVMVAVLANRGEKGKPSTVKAIVVTPVPTREAILADAAASSWLDKIIDKELNHVAVRALRNADDVESVQDQMPLSLADYVTSSRESTGGIMESFNTLFKGIIATVAAKSPLWAKARLIKSELKKAFESRAYALEVYPKLEDRGDKPSLFVMALQLGEREAKAQGLAPDIFAKWLATRDEKTLTAVQDDEADDFDLDSLAFVADEPEAPAADPATPATAG